MGKYIPGNPKLIVQHKPGAGGSKAVAYVYQVAAKDGTAIITPNAGVALRVMLGIIKGAYDPTKFTWVGGWGEAANVLTLRKDIAPAMTLEEAKQKEVILGANPSAVKQYEGLKHTDDRHDAFWLAHLLSLGILPEGYIYPKEDRPVRDLLRKRSFLVRQRTSHILSLQSMSERELGQRISSREIKKLKTEDMGQIFKE